MYEAYFQLRKRPFAAVPDVGCWYAPPSVQNALDELALRAASGEGIGVLTAVAGLGKTILCRLLARELEESFTPVFLANANFATRRALLQAIHFELGRRYSGMDEQELRLELISLLKDFVHTGRGLVLIVDEAHLLNERLLEELRSLSSQSEEEQPLARVVLAGQPALEEKLIDPALQALNQRIVSQVYLEPFTRQESVEYVEHRVGWAGGDAHEIFSPEALDAIVRASGGVPRCLNQLCDHSLLLACVHETSQATCEVVEEALADLKQLPLQWNDSPAAADDADDVTENRETGDTPDETPVTAAAPAGESPAPHVPALTGATVAFEIGGGADEFNEADPITGSLSNDWRVAEPANLGVAPAPSPVLAAGSADPLDIALCPGVRVFQEEPVDDRYALLDVHAPRISRTFDDLALAADSRSLPSVIPGVPAAPPAIPGRDSRIGAIASVDASAMIPAAVPESDPAVADCPAQFDMASNEIFEVEEEIGDNLLEVCLEVRNSLGNWWEPPAESDAVVEITPEFVGADRPSLAAPTDAGQYDVVQPEPRGAGALSEERRDVAAERHVPPPNYRHVFSTLRRKLGRPLRGR